MDTLETLRSRRQEFLNRIKIENSDLDYLMSGEYLAELQKELARLNEECEVAQINRAISGYGAQKESILHYQISSCEETIELIESGARAQEHLQCLTSFAKELAIIGEKIEQLETLHC
jgi:DNA polymerase/3'-5' exonuclease PolX